jgi:hypothetical protein
MSQKAGPRYRRSSCFGATAKEALEKRGTSIRASSIAGLLRAYHCCTRRIRDSCFAEACGYVARGYGGRPLFLRALVSWGSINAISACQGTTDSISERNVSRLVCFLAVVSS